MSVVNDFGKQQGLQERKDRSRISQERRHLAGDRGDDDWCLLAGGGESAVAGAQAYLRLLGDLTNSFW